MTRSNPSRIRAGKMLLALVMLTSCLLAAPVEFAAGKGKKEKLGPEADHQKTHHAQKKATAEILPFIGKRTRVLIHNRTQRTFFLVKATSELVSVNEGATASFCFPSGLFSLRHKHRAPNKIGIATGKDGGDYTVCSHSPTGSAVRLILIYRDGAGNVFSIKAEPSELLSKPQPAQVKPKFPGGITLWITTDDTKKFEAYTDVEIHETGDTPETAMVAPSIRKHAAPLEIAPHHAIIVEADPQGHVVRVGGPDGSDQQQGSDAVEV